MGSADNRPQGGGSFGEITGVKLVHELMVDIMGGLIPGVLFLFSILVCMVFPIFCYRDFPKFPNEGGYSNGWFWVVVFLTFLILSYVIGHIFYRADIKEPDKADLKRLRKEFFSRFERNIRKIAAEKRQGQQQKRAVEKHVARLLKSEIESLYDGYSPSIEVHGGQFTKEACREAMHYLDQVIANPAHAGNRTEESYNKHVLSILFPEEGGCEFEKFTSRSRAVLDHYEKKFGPLISGVLKTDEKQLKRLLRLSICYGILYFQNETGCDTEERCDFPYMNYYKYLLKRKETELLKYVDWDTPCSRTKNKINKYKIEIQMFASGVYSILNKNESHIRMAASSWHVAVAVEKVVACMIVLTLIPIAAKLYLYFSGGAPEFNDMIHSVVRFFDPRSDMARLCVAFAFPCSMFIALGYIRRRVASFIHYQRLREIYYTLYTYHLWKSRFGAGGEAENLRRSGIGGSGTGGVPPVGKGCGVG